MGVFDKVLDLTNAADARELFAPGVPVSEILVRELPAGAAVRLHVGSSSAQPLTLYPGDMVTLCGAEQVAGVWATWPATPGASVLLAVAIGTGAQVNV